MLLHQPLYRVSESLPVGIELRDVSGHIPLVFHDIVRDFGECSGLCERGGWGIGFAGALGYQFFEQVHVFPIFDAVSQHLCSDAGEPRVRNAFPPPEHLPVPRALTRVLRRFVTPAPAADLRKCRSCGLCVKVCPACAIRLAAGKGPRFDRTRCVRCLCCQEICPEGAIRVGRRFLR